MNRVIFPSVTVRGAPSLICFIKRGMTEPREAITFPYRVQQILVLFGSVLLALAMITFSIIALLIPMALTG